MERRDFLRMAAAAAAVVAAPRTSRAATARIDVLINEPIGTIVPELYGHFTEHLGGVHANLQFSPELEWRNFLQFDNESDSLGINSRVRWILKPGADLFLVWNQTQARVGDSFVPLFQEAGFKLAYTLRF